MTRKTDKNTDDLQVKIEELTQDLQRVHADFVNFRRRSDEERSQLREQVKIGVITQLLPLIDNIDRALAHVPKELEDNQWAKGVGQLAKQFAATLKDLGVEEIKAAGEPFDPHLHEAVSYEDGDGEEIVEAELQKGYRLGDQVIRHSMVRVGRK